MIPSYHGTRKNGRFAESAAGATGVATGAVRLSGESSSPARIRRNGRRRAFKRETQTESG